MKIFVKAKPNAKRELIERIDDVHFAVAVKEPPKQGRANLAVAMALSRYLGKFDILWPAQSLSCFS